MKNMKEIDSIKDIEQYLEYRALIRILMKEVVTINRKIHRYEYIKGGKIRVFCLCDIRNNIFEHIVRLNNACKLYKERGKNEKHDNCDR